MSKRKPKTKLTPQQAQELADMGLVLVSRSVHKHFLRALQTIKQNYPAGVK